MITGHGRYIDDLARPGMVHAAFVRSTVARGRIAGLDVSEARRAPGVVAVLTAAEINPRVHQSGPMLAGRGADPTPRRVLADGDVRYVGEPIVIVVGRVAVPGRGRRRAGQRGHRAAGPGGGRGRGAGRGQPAGAPGAAGQPVRGDPGRGPARAGRPAGRARRTCSPRRSPSTATCACRWRPAAWSPQWDRWTRQLELVIAGQGVHMPRLVYSRMLGIPEDDIRVIMGDVGGSFGQKAFPNREDQAVVVAAVILGRPAGEVDRGPGGEPDQRRARPRGVAADHRGDRRARRAAGRQAHHVENVGAYPAGSNGQKAALASRDVPRALSLVRAGFGGLLRAGGLHEHLRDLRVPGPVDDGDHRPRADGRRHRAEARASTRWSSAAAT